MLHVHAWNDCPLHAGTVLSGTSGSTVRTDQLFFESDFDRTEICVDFEDDTIPCEGDITGTVRLTGSPSVAIGEPRSATVTIQDDDCEKNTHTRIIHLQNNNNMVIDAQSTSLL